ncbi:MAG: hypothetical protein KJ018_09135 [Burkholderiales bacterium]|nr:hypothetical protein [Burkholderiales bacterium]GIK88197.1 MAG: hypothetical protein BroJett026_36780 [Betaproteobacteria bacterium]
MRREVDVERVRVLARGSAGCVGIVALPGPGRARFVLDLAVVTADSAAYPRERRSATRVAIDLSPRHPFLPPAATALTPVFHPHVFASGLVCVGARWVAGEGMDLYVKRLIRLLAFDPLLMNAHSIANAAAQAWYQRTARLHPQAFPTDPAAIAFATGASAPPAGAGERALRTCPGCGVGLRLPAGRSGTVRCPRCGREFSTST